MNAYFQAYVAAYLASIDDEGFDPNPMIDAWDAFVEDVGKDRALEAYWSWQKTLPRDKQSDCDPDGAST